MAAEPQILGVYETVLYAADPRSVAAFYTEVLGLRQLQDADDLSVVFRLPDGNMLLVFNPQVSSQPGRPVPSHGAEGAGHVAFRLEPGSIEAAAEAVGKAGVEIEHEMDWGRGRSIYFRDPAGNSIELVDGDIWPPSVAPGD